MYLLLVDGIALASIRMVMLTLPSLFGANTKPALQHHQD